MSFLLSRIAALSTTARCSTLYRALSVCLCVGVLDTLVSRAKMTELIGMSIGACDSGGPWSYVLDRGLEFCRRVANTMDRGGDAALNIHFYSPSTVECNATK